MVKVNGDPIIEGGKNIGYKTTRINIKSVPFEITTASPLSPGQKDSPYTATISAHGGTPPYVWSLVAGSLPLGLLPSSNNLYQGIISGTPTKVTEGDPPTFTIMVEDAGAEGTKLTKPFSILIEGSCQCSDGTACGACKAGSPPLYCDGAKKTLIENPVCANGGQIGGVPSGEIPKGKLEVDWPNSPRGTVLTGKSLTNLIQYLYEWGIGLGGFAAFIALIIAGFQYLTSVGNAGKMKDAMDRIKSAGLGLVLLFGSFLILNIINPQLTELKIPTTPSGSGGLNSILPVEVKSSDNTCTGATLYSGINYDQSKKYTPDIGLKETSFSPKREIGSVIMKGNCQLILYQLSSCTETADSGSTPLAGNTPNVGLASGGVTLFGCAKLNDLSFKLAP